MVEILQHTLCKRACSYGRVVLVQEPPFSSFIKPGAMLEVVSAGLIVRHVLEFQESSKIPVGDVLLVIGMGTPEPEDAGSKHKTVSLFVLHGSKFLELPFSFPDCSHKAHHWIRLL